MEGAHDKKRDVLDLVGELTREAGMLGGVFGALDAWREAAKTTPEFDPVSWFGYVLVAATVLVVSGIVIEQHRDLEQ